MSDYSFLDDAVVYDLEVYPNLFLLVTKHKGYIEEFEFSQRVWSDKKLGLFMEWNQPLWWVGYNNLRYDGPLLSAFINTTAQMSNTELFNMGQSLISSGWVNPLPNQIDLMAILGFEKRFSLKNIAIKLKHERLEGLPYNFDKVLSPTEIDHVTEYCVNDVLITEKLYKKVRKDVEMRFGLSQRYEMNMINSNVTEIGKNIFKKKLSEKGYTDFKKNTRRKKVFVAPLIQMDRLNPQTNELVDLIKRIRDTVITDSHKFKEEFAAFGCEFTLGVGGLHTKDIPIIITPLDGETIEDWDVASYYPSMGESFPIYPEHIGPLHNDIWGGIKRERLIAKNKDKGGVVDYGLKIAINATFGLLKNEYSFNHDPNLFYAITINGQLMLLDLIEKFYQVGIEVLSANTDGILIRVKDGLQNAKMEIIENWQEQTGMDLEQSIYKKFVQRDVNNYIAQTVKGSVKFKGIFNTKPRLDQEINTMIIPQALKAYFIDGVSIEEFISKPDNDIHDYVVYQNINKKTFRFMADGKELPPVSRFIHTTNGYKVFKVKEEKTKGFIEGGAALAFYDGCLLELANELKGCVSDYPLLNIQWYVSETQKIIDLIENGNRLEGVTQSSFL